MASLPLTLLLHIVVARMSRGIRRIKLTPAQQAVPQVQIFLPDTHPWALVATQTPTSILMEMRTTILISRDKDPCLRTRASTLHVDTTISHTGKQTLSNTWPTGLCMCRTPLILRLLMATTRLHHWSKSVQPINMNVCPATLTGLVLRLMVEGAMVTKGSQASNITPAQPRVTRTRTTIRMTDPSHLKMVKSVSVISATEPRPVA